MRNVLYDLSSAICEKTIASGDYDNIQKAKIKYGLDLLIINIAKFPILIALSYVLKIPIEFLMITTFFGLYRQYGGGYHANGFFGCLALVSIINIVIPFIIIGTGFELNIITLNIVLAPVSLIMAILAPITTKKHPINNQGMRKNIQMKNALTTIGMLIIANVLQLISHGEISTLIVLSAINCLILMLAEKWLN